MKNENHVSSAQTLLCLQKGVDRLPTPEELLQASFRGKMSQFDEELLDKYGCYGRYIQACLELHYEEVQVLTFQDLEKMLNDASIYIGHVNNFLQKEGILDKDYKRVKLLPQKQGWWSGEVGVKPIPPLWFKEALDGN